MVDQYLHTDGRENKADPKCGGRRQRGALAIVGIRTLGRFVQHESAARRLILQRRRRVEVGTDIESKQASGTHYSRRSRTRHCPKRARRSVATPLTVSGVDLEEKTALTVRLDRLRHGSIASNGNVMGTVLFKGSLYAPFFVI